MENDELLSILLQFLTTITLNERRSDGEWIVLRMKNKVQQKLQMIRLMSWESFKV